MEESPPVSEPAPEKAIETIKQEKSEVASEPVEEVKTSPHESEYDSAGSYSEDEGEGEVKSRRSRGPSGSESEGSVGLERESGDGQESLPQKKVDDDEDKKNPQYIPKRGTFYEHDDRTADDDEAAAVPEAEKEKDPKKKVWEDKKEKWGHDRFNDSEQTPKSRAELVSIYGYDIRNEEGPPRARRRRRYGRGPNKYTRNWEDEDAYGSKPALPRPKKTQSKPNLTEDFPPLTDETENEHPPEEGGNDADTNSDYSAKSDHQPEHVNGHAKITPPQASSQPPQENNRPQPRVGSGRVPKPKREIRDSDYRGFTTKTRQGRNVKTEQKIINRPQRKDDYIQSQNFTNRNSNNNVPNIEADMAKLNVHDGVYRGGRHGGQRQGSVPPRLQAEPKGSKRYSSIRQRSLPEATTPPFNQHSNYYANEYNQQGPIPIHAANQIHPSNAQVAQIAPPPLNTMAQVPVTATPILQAAPQFGPPFGQAPPPFLQTGVAPPPFLPQQTPQLINYVPSQPQFPQGYQGYQQQFNTVVTQPTELYHQPQTGITYYSTDQQIPQRAVPLKRPKAAIPIVAPPPLDFKGRAIKEDDLSSYESDATTASSDRQGVEFESIH